MSDGGAGEEDPQIIEQADRQRDRCPAASLMLADGDRRRDIFYPIDRGLIEARQILPHVGGETLEVAALALGEQRVERQAALSGAGHASEDGEFAEWNLDIQAAQVVDANAEKPNRQIRTLPRLGALTQRQGLRYS